MICSRFFLKFSLKATFQYAEMSYVFLSSLKVDTVNQFLYCIAL